MELRKRSTTKLTPKKRTNSTNSTTSKTKRPRKAAAATKKKRAQLTLSPKARATRPKKKRPSLQNIIVVPKITPPPLPKTTAVSSKSFFGTSYLTNVKKKESTTTSKDRFASAGRKILLGQRTTKKFKSKWAAFSPRPCSSRNNRSMWKICAGYEIDKKKLDLQKALVQLRNDQRSKFYYRLTLYIFLIVSLFNVVTYIPIRESYQQNDALESVLCQQQTQHNDLCGASRRIQSSSDIYKFIEHIRQNICNENRQQQQPWYRVGNAQLRQVRSVTSTCTVGQSTYDCHPAFDISKEQRADITITGNHKNSTRYQWSDSLSPLSSHGPTSVVRILKNTVRFVSQKSVYYGTGGYIMNLCETSGDIHLKEWINLETRAISIDFNVINPTTRVFTVGHHLIEINSYGSTSRSSQSASFQLSFGGNPSIDLKMVSWGVLLQVLVTVLVLQRIQDIRKVGHVEFMKDAWNIFAIIHFFSISLLLSNSFWFHFSGQNILQQQLENHQESFIDTQAFMWLYQSILDYASVATSVTLVGLLQFVRISSTLSATWRVLSLASSDVAILMLTASLVLCSFASIGYFAFGHALEGFSSPSASLSSCIRLLFVPNNFFHHVNHPALLIPFIILLYTSTAVLVSVLVIRVLKEYWKSSTDELVEASGDLEYDLMYRLRTRLCSLSPQVVIVDEQIHLYPGQHVNLKSSSLLDEEFKRSNARKRFRCAVWRILALMRFGIKFDTFLHVGYVHTWLQSKKSGGGITGPVKATDIRLSSNFDHKTIKSMLRIGASVKLSNAAQAATLSVKRHCNMYTECVVVETSAEENYGFELTGKERLEIPWRHFISYLVTSFASNFVYYIFKPLIRRGHAKYECYIQDPFLESILSEAIEERHTSLRFDEIYRRIEIHFRRTKRFMNISHDEVGRQATLLMMRFQQSLFEMPSREKEGHNYIPKPHDTSSVDERPLEPLVELLAENCHDLWASGRIAQGWKYGRGRDDDKKFHPNLVPYSRLSKEEKGYDRRTALEALKTIYILKFQILTGDGPIESVKWNPEEYRASSTGGEKKSSSAKKGILYHGDKVYAPCPIDTEHVSLPNRLLSLAHLIAENTHEVWSVARMKAGWTYGPQRNDKHKTHPCLVPYVFLTEEEKEYDFNTAMGTLKTLIAVGFSIRDRCSNDIASSPTKATTMSDTDSS